MTTEPAVTDAPAAARTLRRGLTGSSPAGEWSAPGRVNLIGEHTDYNEGFVLPFAIDRRTHVALGIRPDGVIRVASTFASGSVEVPLTALPALFPSTGSVPGWAAYPLGVAWALVAASGADPAELQGVDVAIASDVPVGAGLSSSAAIESATAAALNDAWNLGLDRVALARVGRTAENDAVGAPTGIMDQMASMLGRPDSGIFLDCRSLDAHVIDLGFSAAGLEVLVVDTGVTHSHATSGYRDRRASCELAARIMGVTALRDVSVAELARAAALVDAGAMDAVTFRRMRHIVTEDQRVLETVGVLQERGPEAIGDLLVASHASMRDDFEISAPELDLAVAAAIDAGAVGARMTGGGFGGAAIALVARGRVDAVKDAVAAAFAASAFTPPTVFAVVPSEGARREG
jgi:galactokinase